MAGIFANIDRVLYWHIIALDCNQTVAYGLCTAKIFFLLKAAQEGMCQLDIFFPKKLHMTLKVAVNIQYTFARPVTTVMASMNLSHPLLSIYLGYLLEETTQSHVIPIPIAGEVVKGTRDIAG